MYAVCKLNKVWAGLAYLQQKNRKIEKCSCSSVTADMFSYTG